MSSTDARVLAAEAGSRAVPVGGDRGAQSAGGVAAAGQQEARDRPDGDDAGTTQHRTAAEGSAHVSGTPDRVKNHRADVNQTTTSAVSTVPPRTGSAQPGSPRTRRPSIFAAYAP